ncbi:hypothetical protein N7462_003252 [Penicillium macrosclerotiorum]|uniref:uncharacterized protein n=1 Tax=Penicillium macrosclerotiorum TaxID=303699 RepID=UPI002547AF0B|nr:uncharacterized protein N7462_003252 [Penicillium macrosclerotiorum]KAJ5688860.1 hypothetical protein N7462_003252 [Penicillium macrosclerotiorum]
MFGVSTRKSLIYVRGLERRIAELEQQLASSTPQNSQNNDFKTNPLDQGTDYSLANEILNPEYLANQSPQAQTTKSSLQGREVLHISPFLNAPSPATENLADELRLLSLEAAAERYLGSSSGLSFAKLTQTVLQRLSPDQDDFIFNEPDSDFTASFDFDLDLTENLNPLLPEQVPSLTQPPPSSPLFSNPGTDNFEGSISLELLQPTHINSLLEFYFAHSHTLYPFVRKIEFESVLWRIYADSLDALAQSPIWQFRIWMVLAIGSTTYCSVSLMDETESIQFFKKAMTYFEGAMGCGDLAGLEVLMLQVSYSFFNKNGPNTWFLVGVAARMATGMGLHTSDAYEFLTADMAEQQKRVFFSLYMMDRVVSLALGRPFAIQDDDITAESFVDADDANINPNGILVVNTLEPSTMAVPLHILELRRIASDIGSRVHSQKYAINITSEAREDIFKDLHRRLIEWRRNMPFPLPDLQSKVPHLCTSWFDFNYYTHINMLYRPSPLSPTPDMSTLKLLAEASGMAIRQAINLHRQRRFAFNWLNLVAVFNSILSLMYSSTANMENHSLVLDHTRAMNDFELAVELLEAFRRKFPSAKKIQGMVQRVSVKLKLHSMPPIGF